MFLFVCVYLQTQKKTWTPLKKGQSQKNDTNTGQLQFGFRFGALSSTHTHTHTLHTELLSKVTPMCVKTFIQRL